MLHITILGHGAVGLTIGSLLYAANLPDIQLTFLLKPEIDSIDRVWTVQNNSLSSILQPELFKSVDSFVQTDILLIAVKTYQIKNAVSSIANILTERSLVMPLSNGIDNANYVKHLIPHSNVFESLAYISCERNENGNIINYSEYPELIVSGNEVSCTIFSSDVDLKLRNFLRCIRQSKIRCKITKKFPKETWKKFIITTSVNGICLLFNQPLGKVLSNRQNRRLLDSCFSEGIEIAKSFGIIFSLEEQNTMINSILKMPFNCIPSLLYDYRKKNPTEINYLNGKIVELGRLKGIHTPVNKSVYELFSKT